MRARARLASKCIVLALLATASPAATAQESGGLTTGDGRFRLKGEVKVHFRHSKDYYVTVGRIGNVDIEIGRAHV